MNTGQSVKLAPQPTSVQDAGESVSLTRDQFDFFQNQGYISLRQLTTSEEVSGLKASIEDLFKRRVGEKEGAQEEFLAGPSHDSPFSQFRGRVRDVLKLGESLDGSPTVEVFRPFHSLRQTFVSNWFEQIVQGARFESLNREFVVGGDNDNHRHARSTLQTSDYVQTAHDWHL